jgi:hypothetical protein
MKCAMCGREIKGMDYIRVNVPNQEDIYDHSALCDGMSAKNMSRKVHDSEHLDFSDSWL